MTDVVVRGPTDEPYAETAARSPGTAAPGFTCVYLTSSIREAERVSRILKPANILLYHAASLDEAEMRLRRAKVRVLLTNSSFRGGNWKDALETASHIRRAVAVVVAAKSADEQLWIAVLELGAYDLVQKPFEPDDLRRILETASVHATTGNPLRMTA